MNRKLIAIGIMLVYLMVGFSGCSDISNTINPQTNRFLGDWSGGAIKISMFSDGTVKYKDGKNQ